jgi:hypothetical protein
MRPKMKRLASEMPKKTSLPYELYGSSAAGKKAFCAGQYSRAKRKSRCSSALFSVRFQMQKNTRRAAILRLKERTR